MNEKAGNKKTHSKEKSGKIAMKKKKLLNSWIQHNKYNDFFVKKILFSKNLGSEFRIIGL